MAKKEASAAVQHVNIGISDKDRKKIAEGLSRLLADTYTLYLKTLMVPRITIPMGSAASVF
ncbi:hypothetical protein BCh11DRAFT_03937 [Burkholderia sp. Ch1-1]|nr:hypothetical protein BCh11DRAFT_03937 [Burkholderia sp. Ch1-1]